MKAQIPPSWQPHVGAEVAKPYFEQLTRFLDQERSRFQVYPPESEVFSALELTSWPDVKVLILGQDPYHGAGQAHGLAFSVRPGVPAPPSLKNIFKEMHDDIGCAPPDNGCLVPWARRGVLLLNAVLTVRAGQANSHNGRGWEPFTDSIIRALGERAQPVVFLFWGAYAAKKRSLIRQPQHSILQSAHPSPLSAHNGFFGSRPFSRTNVALVAAGQEPVDWRLPEL